METDEAREISKSEYLHQLSIEEGRLLTTYLHCLSKLHQLEEVRRKLAKAERDGFVVKFWKTDDDVGFTTETKEPVGFRRK